MATPTIQVVRATYGGVEITDQGVFDRIQDAISKRQPFQVTPANLIPDPKVGVVKYAVIDWRESYTGPLLRATAKDFDYLFFNYYVTYVNYGTFAVQASPEVYARLNTALWAPRQQGGAPALIVLNNQNLGGDPKYLTPKVGIIEIRNASGAFEQKTFTENANFPLP